MDKPSWDKPMKVFLYPEGDSHILYFYFQLLLVVFMNSAED